MKIINKIIKGKKYYYLKHSKREGKNIETKEKYIGTEIPENIDETINEFMEEFRIEINKKLESIKKNLRRFQLLLHIIRML